MIKFVESSDGSNFSREMMNDVIILFRLALRQTRKYYKLFLHTSETTFFEKNRKIASFLRFSKTQHFFRKV